MDEYIERKAVLLATDILDEYLNDCERLYFVKQIKNIPAADVVEVRHGRWINDGEDWFCNRCNHNALCDKMTGVQVASAICPNCGAKMDGKGEGE